MTAVDVYLRDVFVGVLSHRSAAGDASTFRLADEYVRDPFHPILGQIFEDDPDRVWRTSHRVPAWFSNLLPEGLLRELLAKRAGVNPERELHLLAELGEDLPGAVVIRPRPGAKVEAVPLRKKKEEVGRDESLRFSLAGLQLKFPASLDEHGPTIPLRGQGGRWIAKLPDARFDDVPINEATMLEWAERSGLDVPEHRLVQVSDIRHLPPLGYVAHGPALVVRRFDRREDGDLTHIEDFAQVLDVMPDEKYRATNFETIGRILAALCGESCVREYVRRLVFMVMSGNADMHLKNWSLIYSDRRRPTLAPAYDLVATRAFPGTNRDLALNFAKTRKFEDIDRSSFRRLARKLDLDADLCLDWVGETVAVVREQWPSVKSNLPAMQARAIEEHLQGLRL